MKNNLTIFNHTTDQGNTVSTLDILNGYIKKVFNVALQDIADRHFEIREDFQGEKFVVELRSNAQVMKLLGIDKNDYMHVHSKTLMAVYRSVFIEFNRAYWRDEKNRKSK